MQFQFGTRITKISFERQMQTFILKHVCFVIDLFFDGRLSSKFEFITLRPLSAISFWSIIKLYPGTQSGPTLLQWVEKRCIFRIFVVLRLENFTVM